MAKWLTNVDDKDLGTIFRINGGVVGKAALFLRAEGHTVAAEGKVGVFSDDPENFRFEPVDPANPDHVRSASKLNSYLVGSGRVPAM